MPLRLDAFFDYDEGLAYAKKVGKPVLIDFTGHACVNCRKMEANVWPGKQVLPLLRDQYVLIQLYIETIARRPGELVIPYSKYVLPNDLTVIATDTTPTHSCMCPCSTSWPRPTSLPTGATMPTRSWPPWRPAAHRP